MNTTFDENASINNDISYNKELLPKHDITDGNISANRVSSEELLLQEPNTVIEEQPGKNSLPKVDYDRSEKKIEMIFQQKTVRGIVPRGSLYFNNALTHTLKKARENYNEKKQGSPIKFLKSLKKWEMHFDMETTEDSNNQSLRKDIEALYENNLTHFEELENTRKKEKSSLIVLKSYINIASDFIQAILALASVVVYIMVTDHNTVTGITEAEDAHVEEDGHANWLFITEFVVTVMGVFDFLHQIVEAKNKFRHFLKITTILDFVTLIPFWLSITIHFKNQIAFVSILQICKVLRLLRLWRLFKEPAWENGENNQSITQNVRYSLVRQVIIFICYLIAALCIGAGISKELDSIFPGSYIMVHDDKQTSSYSGTDGYLFLYFDAFYMVCQTLITSGIGDVYPVGVVARLHIVIFIVIFIVIIYDQIAKIYELNSKMSPYDFIYKYKNHIVVMGYFNEYSVCKFITDAFASPELRDKAKKILIISQEEPGTIIQSMMATSIFENHVKYLVCDFKQDQLKLNGNLENASAIFFFNEHVVTKNIEKNDGDTMLVAKIVHEMIPYTRKIIQINDNSKGNSLTKQLNFIPMTSIFSTRSLKINIITNSIFAQGVTTVFGNLMCPTKDSPVIRHMNNIFWYLEYGRAVMQDLFCVKFSKYFVGHKFQEICEILFCSINKNHNNSGILLIGVKSFSIANEKGIVYINPFNYVIKPADYGLVIATDIQSAEFLTYYAQEVDLTSTGMIKSLELNIFSDKYKQLNTSFKNAVEKEKKFSSDILTIQSTYKMWRDDLNGRIKSHIILLCPLEYLNLVIGTIRNRTNKPVVFVTDGPVKKEWELCCILYSNIFYCECDILDLEQINRLAIKDAYHVLIFSTNFISSTTSDSNSLLFVNTLDYFFDIPYTFELYDENQMRYVGNRARGELSKLSYNYWPKYVAGRVFLAAQLDSFCVSLYLNDIMIDFANSLFELNDVFTDFEGNSNGNSFVQYEGYDDYQDHLIEKIDASEEEILTDPSKLIQNKNIFRIPLPEKYVGSNWSTLFRDLISLKPTVIALALCTQRYTKLQFATENSDLDISSDDKGNSALMNSTINSQDKTDILKSLDSKIAPQQHSNEIQKQNTKSILKPLFDSVTKHVTEVEIENLKHLDLSLVITNPLPTTSLQKGDEIIIFGRIVDKKALTKRIKRKTGATPLKTKSYIENMVKRRYSKLDDKIKDPIEDKNNSIEIVNLCIENVKKRVNPGVSYMEKIKEKELTLEKLLEKLELLKGFSKSEKTEKKISAFDAEITEINEKDEDEEINSKSDVRNESSRLLKKKKKEIDADHSSSDEEEVEEGGKIPKKLNLLKQLHPDLFN